ncbi:MAG: M1 family metallopeptidase [bacterium]
MRRFRYVVILLLVFHILVPLALSQRLPEGAYNTVRERSYDILHYKLEASFEFDEHRIIGKSTIKLRPLGQLISFALDAIHLDVQKVTYGESSEALNFESSDGFLDISLPNKIGPQDTFVVTIDYESTPKAGMYFRKDVKTQDLYYVTTYGEDGLHANWMPVYNDINDKFSSEMIITVPLPYVVVSNGGLVDDYSDGKNRVFHWLQELPHPNYLIALYVGDFEREELRPAFDSIPLAYWVPRGRLSEGAYAFRNTTRMVEFFSERFSYRYPWDKYDQIAVPDYAIGAMEHTGVTGHRANVLTDENAPLEFNPTFADYFDNWTGEAIISHELAHHWFGDLVTCGNLSYIWLNESFASYLMMLWDEESLGRDRLLFDVDLAKKRYFDYVHNQHIIRPLEYHYFDDGNTIYNVEHTYLKGAAILHMLRSVLGDEAYFGAMSHYLHKHEFGNVVSSDLKIAIQEATGQNLEWFFEDWVTGGGHPVFEVSYRYLADRQLIDLSVSQVQPIVEGQDLFTLPVDVTIATNSQTWKERLWVLDADEKFLIRSGEKPLMVSFDGEGSLVAELTFDKDAGELAYQAIHDAVPGRMWAIRQLALRYPTHGKTLATFRDILESSVFWGMKAEAAKYLGKIRTNSAEDLVSLALKEEDYRIRKAGVLALADFGTQKSIAKLKALITNDSHSDVAAAAIVALGRCDPDLDANFIEKQLSRESWYDEIKIASLQALAMSGDPDHVSTFKKYASDSYNQAVRLAALNGWQSCNPGDMELHRLLMKLTESPVYNIQQRALAMLGELCVSEAVPVLESIMDQNADANLVVAAMKALDEIRRIEEASK